MHPDDTEQTFEESLLGESNTNGDGSSPSDAPTPKFHHPPRVYFQRWIQLAYLSSLALLSDWVCFSLAAAPEVFEEYYGRRNASANLIDLFLYVNVASSFCVTDVVARYGMQATIRASAFLMCLGCWFRSGFNFLDNEDQDAEEPTLMPYPAVVMGTVLVAAAQPFVQCTPPLLSAQWFASSERATSTAVALNFNQVGIATAFLVGGNMATSVRGLARYFGCMAIVSTLLLIGTFLQYQEEPEIAPSTSEWNKRASDQKEPPFRKSVMKFFSTKGFTRPLIAFICSISITNIVGAFIDEFLGRVGITNKMNVALVGAGFEFAIVLGGILLGGYVDHTKRYKRVTLTCLILSAICLLPLGFTTTALSDENTTSHGLRQLGTNDDGSSSSTTTTASLLVVLGMLGLGFFAGPIQPINAELAVDVIYPGDETAVESVQQIGGNLVSALLVPVAEWAARKEVPIGGGGSDDSEQGVVCGDLFLLLGITILTFAYFRGFDAQLKRSMEDSRDDEMREHPDGVEMSEIHFETEKLLVV